MIAARLFFQPDGIFYFFLDLWIFEGVTMTPVGVTVTGFLLNTTHEAIWKPKEPAARTHVIFYIPYTLLSPHIPRHIRKKTPDKSRHSSNRC